MATCNDAGTHMASKGSIALHLQKILACRACDLLLQRHRSSPLGNRRTAQLPASPSTESTSQRSRQAQRTSPLGKSDLLHRWSMLWHRSPTQTSQVDSSSTCFGLQLEHNSQEHTELQQWTQPHKPCRWDTRCRPFEMYYHAGFQWFRPGKELGKLHQSCRSFLQYSSYMPCQRFRLDTSQPRLWKVRVAKMQQLRGGEAWQHAMMLALTWQAKARSRCICKRSWPAGRVTCCSSATEAPPWAIVALLSCLQAHRLRVRPSEADKLSGRALWAKATCSTDGACYGTGLRLKLPRWTAPALALAFSWSITPRSTRSCNSGPSRTSRAVGTQDAGPLRCTTTLVSNGSARARSWVSCTSRAEASCSTVLTCRAKDFVLIRASGALWALGCSIRI